jgi:hypothetical protein
MRRYPRAACRTRVSCACQGRDSRCRRAHARPVLPCPAGYEEIPAVPTSPACRGAMPALPQAVDNPLEPGRIAVWEHAPEAIDREMRVDREQSPPRPASPLHGGQGCRTVHASRKHLNGGCWTFEAGVPRVPMSGCGEILARTLTVPRWPGAAVPNVRRKQTVDKLRISAKGSFAVPAPTGSRRPTPAVRALQNSRLE